ncbi:Aldehyde/histidinol dehydrogenase [Boeremia exigua]|uniref:Aldehyde/histidinol dehydrogenase n=1 Tax=Boeremia exigua TaxID=749465 RepID=UPI001E8EF058|nr:Aldehyde/histidinol dehydrogenase [Boeremia exigua]KAH6620282.1 Aldehyde/histidinol dehydrogenase [Boeremia exigua]
MTTKFETRLFINGKFVDASTPERFSCWNPKDNSLISDQLHVATVDDVNAAVAAARAAFPLWAATPPSRRRDILLKFADLIDAHREEISGLEVATGKPVTMARGFEIDFGLRILRYSAGWADKLLGETAPADSDDGMLRIITNEPLGVCAGICPFNVPIAMALAKIAPALTAGNSIIIKPSEKTPLGTLVLGRLANEAGIPPGVLNIVLGGGQTGALLASHMGVDKVSFTGSNATGKKIAVAAVNSNLKRVSLELGGKSAAIIFPDADLDKAVRWCTIGITTNSGQGCICTSRIYVHKSIRERFLSLFKQAFIAVEASAGDPTSPATGLGPVVDRLQFERIMGYVASGKEQATLFQGGERIGDQGCFIQPTIFVDPSPDAKILHEEIFGPVVVVSDFEDEADVIARVNDTPYGLSGAVYSQDINRALRVSSRIHSGTVCINSSLQVNAEVPFGGVKQSGWEREYGKDGVLAYTEKKTTFINLN